MNRMQSLFLFLLLTSFGFSQEEEKNGRLSLIIRNEMGEPFKGTILLITNHDTISITASWNNRFEANLIPGTYRMVLKNKLFDDYFIDSVQIKDNVVKEMEIVWKHRIMRLPEVTFSLCDRY